LALAGGQLKKLHVLLVGDLFGMSRMKQVVSDPKLAGRKHLFTVSVVLESTRLTNQRIDHVPIVDRPALLPKQPLHGLHLLTLMGHDDLLRGNSHIDFRTDQPAGD